MGYDMTKNMGLLTSRIHVLVSDTHRHHFVHHQRTAVERCKASTLIGLVAGTLVWLAASICPGQDFTDSAQVPVHLSIEPYAVFVLHPESNGEWKMVMQTITENILKSEYTFESEQTLRFTVRVNIGGMIRCPTQITLTLIDPPDHLATQPVSAGLSMNTNYFNSPPGPSGYKYLEVAQPGDYSTTANPSGGEQWVTLRVNTDDKVWGAEDIAGLYHGTITLEYSSTSFIPGP